MWSFNCQRIHNSFSCFWILLLSLSNIPLHMTYGIPQVPKIRQWNKGTMLALLAKWLELEFSFLELVLKISTLFINSKKGERNPGLLQLSPSPSTLMHFEIVKLKITECIKLLSPSVSMGNEVSRNNTGIQKEAAWQGPWHNLTVTANAEVRNKPAGSTI